MYKLIKRLNADISDHYTTMLMYARYFGLPYVEDDLIEIMEFWIDTENNTISITLVTGEIEYLHAKISSLLFIEIITH